MDDNEGMMRHDTPYDYPKRPDNPYDYPKQDKSQSPFSDDWIKHNPWMDRVIEEKEKPPNPDLLLAICFNFRNGVPIPAIQKIQERRKKAKKKAATDYKFFQDMLNEGVSTRHISPPKKGWGNARKYA